MSGNYYPALKQINSVCNSSFGLRKIGNSIAKSAAKAVRGQGCRILFLNPLKRYLVTIGSYGLSDLFLRKGPLDARKSLPDILDGKTVYIADIAGIAAEHGIQYPEEDRKQGIASILGIPIAKDDKVVGEIRIYTREIREFSESDRNFLLSVADVCALLFERMELSILMERSYKADKEKLESHVPQLPTNALRPTSFAHPSEEEFAKLLDFYRIEWLYEPRAFPLRWGDNGVAEMFTPDFYLSEMDLYVELTTLKQSLITEKNRKVRRLKELYPEINIKLLNKYDYTRLLAKYGYSFAGEAKAEGIERILYSDTQIQRRVRVLAKRISQDYAGEKLVLVGILKGVVCFMSDLMRNLSLPVIPDFMAISRYGGDARVVQITKDLDSTITGQHVLMVEDIVDTGMTLNYVLKYILARNPASLHVCTFLDKRVRRIVDVPLKYVGFEIKDEFIVGYGLDREGEYRNLPFIGVLHHELMKEGAKAKQG